MTSVDPRPPIPLTPLVVASLLLMVGLAYVLTHVVRREPAPLAPAALEAGQLRVAQLAGAWPADTAHLARQLSAWGVHAVIAQGVADPEAADALAASLGAGWQAQAIPRGPDEAEFLAVVLHPGLRLERANLIEAASAGFGLAVRVVDPRGRAVQLISAAGPAGDEADHDHYLARVLDWHARHAAQAVVLAAQLGTLDDEQLATSGGRFAVIADTVDVGPGRTLLAVWPPTLPTRQPTVDVPAGWPATRVVDVQLP